MADPAAVYRGGAPRLACLELPVFVDKPATALELLSGQRVVEQSLQQDRDLALHLRPKDPLCRPVVGYTKQTGQFLLRVRRRKRAPATSAAAGVDSPPAYTASIVATMPAAVMFDVMADFQFLPQGVPLRFGHRLLVDLMHAVEVDHKATVPNVRFVDEEDNEEDGGGKKDRVGAAQGVPASASSGDGVAAGAASAARTTAPAADHGLIAIDVDGEEHDADVAMARATTGGASVASGNWAGMLPVDADAAASRAISASAVSASASDGHSLPPLVLPRPPPRLASLLRPPPKGAAPLQAGESSGLNGYWVHRLSRGIPRPLATAPLAPPVTGSGVAVAAGATADAAAATTVSSSSSAAAAAASSSPSSSSASAAAGAAGPAPVTIIPRSSHPWVDVLSASLMVVPAVFSSVDRPQQYSFRMPATARKGVPRPLLPTQRLAAAAAGRDVADLVGDGSDDESGSDSGDELGADGGSDHDDDAGRDASGAAATGGSDFVSSLAAAAAAAGAAASTASPAGILVKKPRGRPRKSVAFATPGDSDGGGAATVSIGGSVVAAQPVFSLLDSKFALTTSSDVAVPAAPLPTPRGHVLRDKCILALRRAFALRPVWLLPALAAFMTPLPRDVWKNFLPAAAYCVTSGAFRRSWIRLGYDPRTDPDSRIFQVIDLRAPAPFIERIPAKTNLLSAARKKSGIRSRAAIHVATSKVQAQRAGSASGTIQHGRDASDSDGSDDDDDDDDGDHSVSDADDLHASAGDADGDVGMAGSFAAGSAAAAGSGAAPPDTIRSGSGYGLLKRRDKESAYVAGKTLTRRTLVQIVDLFSIDLPTMLTDVATIPHPPEYARIIAQAMAPSAASAATAAPSSGDAATGEGEGGVAAPAASTQSWTHQRHPEVLDALVRRYSVGFDQSTAASALGDTGVDAFGVVEDAATAFGAVTVAVKGSSTVFPLNAAAVSRLLAAVPSTATTAASAAGASSSSASSGSSGAAGGYDEMDGWLSPQFTHHLRCVLSLYTCYLIAREFPPPGTATATVNGVSVTDKEADKLEELTLQATGQRRRPSVADAGAKPAKRAGRPRAADKAVTGGDDAQEGAPKRGRKKKAAAGAPVVDPAALAAAAPTASELPGVHLLAGLYSVQDDPYGLHAYLTMPAGMPEQSMMTMSQYPPVAPAAAALGSSHPPPHSTAPPVMDDELESAFV